MTPLEAVIDYIQHRREIFTLDDIDRLTTEGMELLVQVAEAAGRLNEAEAWDTKVVGHHLVPGDSALAMGLNTLYARLAALHEEREESHPRTQKTVK